MKKTTLTFSTLLLALALAPAFAQDAADNNNPPASAATPAEPAAPPDAAPGAPTVEVIEAVLAADAAARGEQPKDPEATSISPSQKRNAPRDEAVAEFMPPEMAGTNGNDLNLNFNRAPLEMVLNYLSDSAGFIIVQDTRVNGNVTVNGKHLTRNEAVDLLNSVLNKNGYAAIRDGRTLTIVDKNDAKTRDIPVKIGNEPESIPKNAEIVTQIMPIRFVEARQLISDLSSFVSPQATVVANEAGNAIVITDTQANIRHLAEIIKAVDNSAEAETEIRVFHLKYASPSDVATELASIFPSNNGGTQSPIRFGGNNGGGGGGGGGRANFIAQMMGGGAGGANASNDRIKKATQVTAVADARIQAVVVTAPRDLMEQIGGMMKDLDVPSTRDQKVYVFHMDNGDPQQAAQVLQGMFQGNNARTTSSSSTTSALQTRERNNATSTGTSSGTTTFGGSSGGVGGGRGGQF